MNGISGVSFQEVPGGLRVRVKKSSKGSSKGSSSGKLRKRLPYNFKQISKQIMQAKTSNAARPLVTKMQAKLSWLYKKLRSGDYGDSEIAAAIIHAAEMQRIAKRKVKHLEQEEAAENGMGAGGIPAEDGEGLETDKLQESLEENEEISDEMMQEMMDDIKELEEELLEASFSEMEDLALCTGGDLSEEEIEELKRKHRGEEERQITRADLKYLKALFDRLEQEKKQASSGVSSISSSDTSNISFSVDCLPEVETTNIDIGECFDAMV